jgi:act minimal PKS ketosynthase (KS/KS alpha)
MTRRRVVVTGVGVVAPGRTGTRAFWEMITAGRTATRRISLFDPKGLRSQIAAECEFDPERQGLTADQARRLDRAVQLALVAAREAVDSSGIDLDALPPEHLGVTMGSAVGCTTGLEEQYVALSEVGQRWLVNPGAPDFLYGHMVPSTIACEVAYQVGAEGPVNLISTGCTSGLDSVGHAVGVIAEGNAEVMVAGASDAPISPITMACFDAIKATSPDNNDPEHASRPFDLTRRGFVMGEGAAVFVLEEYERAKARGAEILAEIAGFASRSNAFHMTGLKPDGREMAEAIRAAMDQARLNPTDIDYINAHGSGTKQNDRHETAAFKASLGEHAYRTPVSSIKSMVGHSLGAIGSIEIAACVLALTNDVVPPTANLHVSDPQCDLDYVPLQARERSLDAVLTVGSGFGGFQSAMVLSTVDGAGR